MLAPSRGKRFRIALGITLLCVTAAWIYGVADTYADTVDFADFITSQMADLEIDHSDTLFKAVDVSVYHDLVLFGPARGKGTIYGRHMSPGGRVTIWAMDYYCVSSKDQWTIVESGLCTDKREVGMRFAKVMAR